MKCTVRNFDRLVLTPLFWFINCAAIIFLLSRLWLWLLGAVLASLYVGMIGSFIHPRQSYDDLCKDAVKDPHAQNEERSLTPLEHRSVVSQACTHVGILVGVTVFTVLWSLFDWRWYLASAMALVSMIFCAAILKVVFKAV